MVTALFLTKEPVRNGVCHCVIALLGNGVG
jgi:hypothetical protein